MVALELSRFKKEILGWRSRMIEGGYPKPLLLGVVPGRLCELRIGMIVHQGRVISKSRRIQS